VTGPGSRASELFLALAEVPAADREAWLDAHCGDNPALRSEIESLLGALDAPEDFLDPSALHPHVLDADTPLTPGTRLADFTIQRVIGSGSAGIVYIAQQRHPQRTVALKVLRRGLAVSAARRRFEVEAELLGQLHHPGIAHIFAAHPGDETIPPFIAMELVDGPPITDYVVEHRLDARAKVEVMIRVCEAVQHAHQRGVIHRDLKPANVLVGRDGEPKVLDFGVARRSGAAVPVSTVTTEVGQLVGTVAYMSPEQITAVPWEVDTRSDVYALGVILFRLLAGRLPFADDNPPLPELARRIALEDAPRLSTVDRTFAGDLDTILATALAKDKERRYQSAADLAADLRRYLAGQPIAAAADSAWYLVRTRLVRYRRALTAAVVSFVALGALAAFALVQRSRAEATNVRLGDELSTSNIERARLLGITGNLRAAESALWHELFDRPNSLHARWALWELYSRESALWTRVLHPGGASTVYLDAAGGRLITAGRDARIRIVDPLTGHERQVLEGEAPDVFVLAVTPQTGTVVAGSTGGILRIWDAAGRPGRSIEVGAAPLTGMSVVGADLVAASAGGRTRIWSISNGNAVEDISLPADQTTLIDITADRRLLALGTETGEVITWNLSRREVQWRVKAHRDRVSAIRFNPQGTALASGGGDHIVALHDGESGRLLHRAEPANGTVRSLVFDATGRRLAMAGWWRTLLWDISAEGLREVTAFSEPTWRLDLSADAELLVTCTEAPAGEVRAWQVRAEPRLAQWSPHTDRVVALSTTGELPTIASGGAEGTVVIQGLSSSSPSLRLTQPDGLIGLQFDASGRHILTASRTGQLAAWEIATGQPGASIKGTDDASAFGASSDGEHLVLGQGDGRLASWRWTGQDFERRFLAPAEGGQSLGIAVSGDRIAVAHRAGLVLVHDAAQGDVVHRLATEGAPFAVAWSPDRRLLAVGTWSGGLEVWDAATGRRLRTLRVHARVITGLAWSDDPGLLASASRDGTVRLWDVERGHVLATLAAREVGVHRVQVLPRDRLLVGYDDGVVEVRDMAYFFRHVAGQADYQRAMLEQARGIGYPRAQEVIDWSRRILAHQPR
jgi:WD40 repeat protein